MAGDFTALDRVVADAIERDGWHGRAGDAALELAALRAVIAELRREATLSPSELHIARLSQEMRDGR